MASSGTEGGPKTKVMHVAGPEVKCLERMIAAIDAMEPPPQTREEKERLVDHWRSEEVRLHRGRVYGEIASREITVEEIDSIVRTRKFRRGRIVSAIEFDDEGQGGPARPVRPVKSGSKVEIPDALDDDAWEDVSKYRRRPRLPMDIVSVPFSGGLFFGQAVSVDYGIRLHKSVQISRPKDDAAALRLRFGDQRGQGWYVLQKLLKSGACQVDCRDLTGALGINGGYYKLRLVKEDPLTMIVDLRERVGEPKRRADGGRKKAG